MRIKPTMSHAVSKGHLNELLVKYYQDLMSEHDQVVSGELRDAITEINTIVKSNVYYGELRCCDGELYRLISLCETAQSELGFES